MNIAFLWPHPSRYLMATLEAIAKRADVQLLCLEPSTSAPFELGDIFDGSFEMHTFETFPSAAEIGALLRPGLDGLVVSSWHIPSYRSAARALRGRTTRVLFMDNQWLGSPRQRLGAAISRYYVQPLYDLAIVPGDRQAQFARRLGFRTDRLIWGGYTCDTAAHTAVSIGGFESRRRFLFVGRLAAEKGIASLVTAYARYRAANPDPWDLWISGTGPEEHLLRGQTGVRLLGFTPPGDLPSLLQEVGCLVLPSIFEPWGVVVHEAACAAVPVVATYACGAVPHLVENGFNGYVTEPGSAHSLESAMHRISTSSEDVWLAMCRASRLMSARYSPELVANNLIRAIKERRSRSRDLFGEGRHG